MSKRSSLLYDLSDVARVERNIARRIASIARAEPPRYNYNTVMAWRMSRIAPMLRHPVRILPAPQGFLAVYHPDRRAICFLPPSPVEARLPALLPPFVLLPGRDTLRSFLKYARNDPTDSALPGRHAGNTAERVRLAAAMTAESNDGSHFLTARLPRVRAALKTYAVDASEDARGIITLYRPDNGTRLELHLTRAQLQHVVGPLAPTAPPVAATIDPPPARPQRAPAPPAPRCRSVWGLAPVNRGNG